MKFKIDIDHICTLARLNLTYREKKYLTPQMIKIVEWVNKLEKLKIDISGEEVYSFLSFSLPFRKDEVCPSFPTKKALANSPEKNEEFIKVPKVIQEK